MGWKWDGKAWITLVKLYRAMLCFVVVGFITSLHLLQLCRNCKWTCACLIALFDHLKHFTTLVAFISSHTEVRGCHVRCQLHIRSNLGFSILLRDSSTCSSAQPGGAGIRTSDLPITRLESLVEGCCDTILL